jgi:hypothetical protein
MVLPSSSAGYQQLNLLLKRYIRPRRKASHYDARESDGLIGGGILKYPASQARHQGKHILQVQKIPGGGAACCALYGKYDKYEKYGEYGKVLGWCRGGG